MKKEKNELTLNNACFTEKEEKALEIILNQLSRRALMRVVSVVEVSISLVDWELLSSRRRLPLGSSPLSPLPLKFLELAA